MSDDKELDPLLLGLIVSLQSAAMMDMGKLANPQTGQVQRRLDQARNTIDLLSMLRGKMTGNLTGSEAQYIDHVLYELRINYVEESERPDPATTDDPVQGEKDTKAEAPSGSSSQ